MLFTTNHCLHNKSKNGEHINRKKRKATTTLPKGTGRVEYYQNQRMK